MGAWFGRSPASRRLSLGKGEGRAWREVPRRSLPRLWPPGPRLAAPRPPPAGQAGDWRLVRAIWAKAGEKLRCGNPTRRVRPGWGRRGPGAWWPRPHHTAPEAGLPDTRLSCPFLSFPFRSPPLPPASLPGAGLTWRRGAGRRGRGGGGLRGGSRACSGAGSRAAATAAARSAPRPPLHQSFKPAWGAGGGARDGRSAPFRLHPLQAQSSRATFGFCFCDEGHTS